MSAPNRDSPHRRPEAAELDAAVSSDGFAERDEPFEADADRALKQRPVFTIRARLVLGFSLLFLLCLLITLWAINVLANVQERLLFLEAAGDVKAEIQQARRFEKNYLLYRTNLEDAREHVLSARRLTERNAERFVSVVGEEALVKMDQHLAVYLALLDRLSRSAGPEQRAGIETELRNHGAVMVSLAQDFVSKERSQVHSQLSLARRIPLGFLGLLFVLMLLIAGFLLRYIIGGLGRFMDYTRRIGTGDVTPITPTRRYRDEFSELALVLNRMVRDLERQHRILVESHKLRAMGTLVAGVAHELNNPLNNIMLTASLLNEEAEELDTLERREMLQDLMDQAERASRTVGNLLDFARETETKVEPLDLRRLLDETTEFLRNQLRVKKIRLKWDLPENLPPVHGDRQLLSQVFMNLILNALEVLPEKGKIQLAADAQREDGFVAVDITDNGPGVAEHILPRIFDPFFTTKPPGKSMGLGLSVSRSIVRKLGGYLSVSSELGKGTTFTVVLPITTIPSRLSATSEGEGRTRTGAGDGVS